MSGSNVTYDQLLETGWALNESKGISSLSFTSVSFCLRRDGHMVTCVQGYGPTRHAALFDAALEANAWLRAEQLRHAERLIGGQPRRRRGYRVA